MRRKPGEGTIHQRKTDGKWMAAYQEGRNFITGKGIRRFVYGDTEAEVRNKLEQLRPTDHTRYLVPADKEIGFSVDSFAEMLSPCVYHLLSGGEVVYIGETECALQRLQDHYFQCRGLRKVANSRVNRKGEKMRFCFDGVKIFFVNNHEERKRKERTDIQRYQPIFNTLYTRWHREPFKEDKP